MFSVSPFVFVTALPRSPAPGDVSYAASHPSNHSFRSASCSDWQGMAWHPSVRQQTQCIRPDAVAEDDGRAMDEDKSEIEQIEYGPQSY